MFDTPTCSCLNKQGESRELKVEFGIVRHPLCRCHVCLSMFCCLDLPPLETNGEIQDFFMSISFFIIIIIIYLMLAWRACFVFFLKITSFSCALFKKSCLSVAKASPVTVLSECCEQSCRKAFKRFHTLRAFRQLLGLLIELSDQ